MREGVAIIGCGGVGSNLAYLLTRGDDKPLKMILIDHDTINEGNLSRQMFSIDDVGENKAEALGAMLKQMNPEIEFETYDMKVESEADLAIITRVGYTFVCTDNMESKRLIDKARRDGFLRGIVFFVGCEHDYFEVKSALDSGDLATWSLESGYNSTQTARSNIYSAFFLYTLWCDKREHANSVIQLADFNEIGERQVTIHSDGIQLCKNKKQFLFHGCKLTATGREGKTKVFAISNSALKVTMYDEREANTFIEEIMEGGLALYDEDTHRISKSNLGSVLEKRRESTGSTGRRTRSEN